MAGSPQSKQAPPLCFMTLPVEMQLKILKLACTHNKTIKPEQLSPGSKTFSLRLDPKRPVTVGYCPTVTRVDGALPSQLSAFDISRSCKKFRDLVIGESLFHASNKFEFLTTQALLVYLAALPSNCRNRIRSVLVHYDYHGVPAAAFIMLGVCSRLESLTLDIAGMTNFFNPDLSHFTQAPGYAQLVALRGVKSVKFDYGSRDWTLIDDILARIPSAWISESKAESEKEILRLIRNLEYDVGELIGRRRPGRQLVTHGELTEAVSLAGIYVSVDLINEALDQPGEANVSWTNNGNQVIAETLNQPVTLLPLKLTEEEQWREIDRTNLASWDV